MKNLFTRLLLKIYREDWATSEAVDYLRSRGLSNFDLLMLQNFHSFHEGAIVCNHSAHSVTIQLRGRFRFYALLPAQTTGVWIPLAEDGRFISIENQDTERMDVNEFFLGQEGIYEVVNRPDDARRVVIRPIAPNRWNY